MSDLLPDPRCFAPPNADPFVALAEADASDALQRDGASHKLIEAYRRALARNDDAAIAASLRDATSARASRRLWDALDRATQPASADPNELVLRVFALPLLLVTGGRAGVSVPVVLPEVGRVQQVLESGGALGPSRNFGFGNVLCAVDALQAIPPSRLYKLQLDPASAGLRGLDLPPSAVATTTSGEEVHLRFLVGASVTPVDAPSFVETAAAIGSWGMALTRELADQLGVEGLSLLPIPRPPASLLAAQAIGFVAREELALQVFVSGTLRRFRSKVGEPQVTLAALASGVLGVRFSSPFVENRVRVHRRPLHPTEEVNEVAASIAALLSECGIADAIVLPEVNDDARFASHPAGGIH